MTHELDAVHRHGWRLLFVLRTMPDEAARRAFILVRIPLFATLFWLVAYPVESVRFWTMLGLDVFMIVHAALHAALHRRLSGHPKYEFHTPTSRFVIYGAAVLAAVHLFLAVHSQGAVGYGLRTCLAGDAVGPVRRGSARTTAAVRRTIHTS